MASGLINKYIWLIDTIMRHKAITRKEINRLWVLNDSLSGGIPIPRRTFHNYCRAAEEMFNVEIRCNTSTFEYFIESEGNEQEQELRNWLLDSVAISGTLSNSKEIASRIILEDVPSARNFLSTIIEGIKLNRRLSFTYQSFDRSGTANVLLDPYFVRIFKQRWYVIGFQHQKKEIRTYALDRIKEIQISTQAFKMPQIEAKDYFKYSFGIFTDKAQPQEIAIRVISEQAKYLRVLPIHSSQREEVHDDYSIFHYHMLLTYDLVQEILSLGAKVEVIKPETLRIRIKAEIEKLLSIYNGAKLTD